MRPSTMLNLQDTTVKPFPLSSMVIHKYINIMTGIYIAE